jgi:hypothetical protein
MPYFGACYNIFMTFRSRLMSGAFSATLLLPLATFAQGALKNPLVPTNCQGADAARLCSVCDLALLAQNVLNAGIYIMIILAAVMFAYAGFEAVTAGGNSEKYGKAVRVFGNVFIGLVIVLVSWLVIDTLMKTLVKQDGKFGPWNKVCNR